MALHRSIPVLVCKSQWPSLALANCAGLHEASSWTATLISAASSSLGRSAATSCVSRRLSTVHTWIERANGALVVRPLRQWASRSGLTMHDAAPRHDTFQLSNRGGETSYWATAAAVAAARPRLGHHLVDAGPTSHRPSFQPEPVRPCGVRVAKHTHGVQAARHTQSRLGCRWKRRKNDAKNRTSPDLHSPYSHTFQTAMRQLCVFSRSVPAPCSPPDATVCCQDGLDPATGGSGGAGPAEQDIQPGKR